MKVVITDNGGNFYGIVTINTCGLLKKDYIRYCIKQSLLESCNNNKEDFFDRFSEHISNMNKILQEKLRNTCTEKCSGCNVFFDYENCENFNVDEFSENVWGNEEEK